MEQEVQLGPLCTRLINAAFILPRWGKMEAVQKDCWYFVVLLFFNFLKVAVQHTDVETVQLVEGMVLNCLCPWDGKLSMVSWTKVPNKSPIAVFHPEHGVSFPYAYRERIEFLKMATLDGSISLKNVTHQDIGLYHCSVQTFPQGPWNKYIRVEDLDEPPEDDNSTEPPPLEDLLADTKLEVEEGSNLTISCKQPLNGTMYRVRLDRMQPDHTWFLISSCEKMEQGLDVESFRDGVDCTDSLDLSLNLTDVDSGDGGFYRCTFNTDLGEQATLVQLTVAPPGGFSLSLYMMYIYIGAGAAGLILFISFLILVMRLRKNNRREEYRVKLHPSRRQPNIYENIPLCPRRMKKSRQNNPIYANLPAGRVLPTAHRPQDKK